MEVSKIELQENIKRQHRKESAGLHHSWKVIALYKGEFKTVIDCRIYWPGTVAYACMWVLGAFPADKTGKMSYGSGSGSAGGGGYHKESAAVHGAIEAAGIKLSESISGRGGSGYKRRIEHNSA